MAEVGLVVFAEVAMKVAAKALPPYRSKFSKRVFTQPQLVSILCLMRYEDWTFREAEVRLREHSELRQALELSRVPDHTAVYRFLRRLPDEAIEHLMAEAVHRLPPPPPGGTTVAVDGTGLSPRAGIGPQCLMHADPGDETGQDARPPRSTRRPAHRWAFCHRAGAAAPCFVHSRPIMKPHIGSPAQPSV